MSVTITDVAEQAGYTIATVSKALNGKRDVRHSTAEKIKAVAEKLGYKANPLARELALRGKEAGGSQQKQIDILTRAMEEIMATTLSKELVDKIARQALNDAKKEA